MNRSVGSTMKVRCRINKQKRNAYIIYYSANKAILGKKEIENIELRLYNQPISPTNNYLSQWPLDARERS